MAVDRGRVEQTLAAMVSADVLISENWRETPVDTQRAVIDWVVRHGTERSRSNALNKIVDALSEGPLQYVGYGYNPGKGM